MRLNPREIALARELIDRDASGVEVFERLGITKTSAKIALAWFNRTRRADFEMECSA